MPNWCENTLEVKGPVRALRAFVEAARSPDDTWPISFSSLYPCPPSLSAVGSGSGDEVYDLYFGDVKKAMRYMSSAPAAVRESREAAIAWYEENMARGAVSPRQVAEAYKANVDQYGHKNWYEWSVANWGTKWDLSEPQVTDNPHLSDLIELATASDEEPVTSISYAFATAWSPPVAGFAKISLDYPALTFTLDYEEEGMSFAGTDTIKNGEVVHADREPTPREDTDEEE